MSDSPFDARSEIVQTPYGAIGINLGTGPVAGATRENAEANLTAFIGDLLLLGDAEVQFNGHEDGRYSFMVAYRGRECEVAMPGLPLEHVRYMGEDGQSILNFPRLYIDGSSWVWEFAIGQARYALVDGDPA